MLSIGLQSGTFTQGGVAGYAPLIGDGEWEWIAISGKVTKGQTNQVANLSLSCDSTHAIDYYGPVLLHFRAGSISDNEAAYLREHLQAIPDTASPADVTTMRGSRFSFGVPNSNFFGKFSSQPFTKDRVFTWPDETGTVALALAATTGTIGGSSVRPGDCARTKLAVRNSTPSMAVSVSPTTYPGEAFEWSGYVSSSGLVQRSESAIAAQHPPRLLLQPTTSE